MRKATIVRSACMSFLLLLFIPLTPTFAGPNSQAVHDRIGEIVASKGEVGYLRAVEELEQVVTTWPEETDALPWALFWVGTISHESGDINRAIEAFERLLEEFPQQLEAGAWARWGLANQCYLPRGEFDKGLPLLLEMVAHSNAYEGSNVPHCGALFLPWARQQLAEYLGKAARAYAEQGRPGEFAHLIRGALIGNWSGPAWEILADTMLALGEVARVRRSPEEREWYQTVVNNYEHFWLPGVPPPSADRDRALRWLSCFQLLFGETRLAKQLCQEVLESESGSTEGALAGALLARIQKAQGLVRRSFSAYRAALASVPASAPPPDALVALLDAYGKRRQWELAIQYVGPFIDTYCASADAVAAVWSGLYHALSTQTQDMISRGEYTAWRGLLQVLLETPLSLEERGLIQSGLAYAYCLEGNYDQAIAVYEAIVSGYPSLPIRRAEALFRLGVVHQAKGDKEQALKAFRRLIAEIPGTNWEDGARFEIEQLSSH